MPTLVHAAEVVKDAPGMNGHVVRSDDTTAGHLGLYRVSAIV